MSAPGSDPFDLMLMDVQMPDMDGFEATVAIRSAEQASGAHIPIVALTANAMKGDEERCLAAGMDGYVSKPIDVEQLFTTIERVSPHDGGTASGHTRADSGGPSRTREPAFALRRGKPPNREPHPPRNGDRPSGAPAAAAPTARRRCGLSDQLSTTSASGSSAAATSAPRSSA